MVCEYFLKIIKFLSVAKLTFFADEANNFQSVENDKRNSQVKTSNLTEETKPNGFNTKTEDLRYDKYVNPHSRSNKNVSVFRKGKYILITSIFEKLRLFYTRNWGKNNWI